MLTTPTPLRLSDPPPGRPRRSLIAKRDQLPVRDIRPDPATRTLDQLVDLPGEIAHRRPAPLGRGHPAGLLAQPDPVRPSCEYTQPAPPRHAACPRGRMPPESPSLPPLSSRRPPSSRHTTWPHWITSRLGLLAEVWGDSWPPTGRSAGISGEIRWSPLGRFSWPPSATFPGAANEWAVGISKRGFVLRQHGSAARPSGQGNALRRRAKWSPPGCVAGTGAKLAGDRGSQLVSDAAGRFRTKSRSLASGGRHRAGPA
jgi:hypothetical protein